MVVKSIAPEANEHVKAAHSVACAANCESAANALADGAAAGIPWQDLVKGFVTLALPVFIKWVQDWLAGIKKPLPDAPTMP